MTYSIVSERRAKESVKVQSPEDVYQALNTYYNKRREHFLTLILDGSHTVQRILITSIGILNRSIVHPREVYAPAIKDGAAPIICAHNHPSGNTEPSSEDREITERLKEAGKILGIPLLDHLVFGKHGYYSFLEHGEL